MATTRRNAAEATIVAPATEEVRNEVVATEEVPTRSSIKTVQQVIKDLLANGCKRIVNMRVKSAKVTEKDNYTMVSLTLDKPIAGYVSDEDGVFEKGETNVIFASTYSLAATLKESDDTAFAANTLIENPKGFEVILAGARIDIIQQEVSADELYVNPFSSRSEEEGESLGHDTIINHVVSINPSSNARDLLKLMALKMMGI